ncbi:uncharacterized protein [Montipora capricornis]|uniref:uncharacterized protein n=1 Tax=Montipora capricornis TaxID=246305 RepID=UPI0035F10AE2
MSTPICRSPFVRKRPVICPVLGEWTCFKRREDLMVVLADVARIQDTSLLKDSFSFSLNAFLALWNRVGYFLSSSEEDFVENASNCREHMRLLPYDDAVEFISQLLTREGKLILKIFNPVYSDSNTPTVETVAVEPLADDDEQKLDQASEGDSDLSEKSSTNDSETRILRRRNGSKRGQGFVSDSIEDERIQKKGKIESSDFPTLDLQSALVNDCCPNEDETLLSLIKAFLQKKEDRMLKQIEEVQLARSCLEERIKELEVDFERHLAEEKEIRRTKDESIKALQDELQISNNKRKALENKLQGIKQFLQVDQDENNTASS